jgi:hypothetical protein
MKRVIALLSCFLLTVLIGFFVPMPQFLKSPYMAEVVETWEKVDAPFPMRIEKHIERGGPMAFMNGAYYVFQSQTRSGWHDVTTVRHDDPDPIPRENVGFAGDRVGWFYMQNQYAVTTDAGEGWQIQNICDFLPRTEHCAGIVALSFGPDGRGEVKIYSVGSNADNQKVMSTSNFGSSWSTK